MPRVTYAHRLAALAAKPLSNYDRGFVESLMQYYSDENLAAAAANPLNERLAILAERVDPGTWDAGFVESITSQVQRGRDISAKQLDIVSKIEARWSDDARAAANTWKQTYLDSAEMQLKAHIVASYYSVTGYYGSLADNILHTEGFVPTEKQYKSITNNKFAKKILEAWYADPKYPVGSYVVVRDTAPGMVRGKAKNVPCVILKTNAAYPRCAAKGTKIYQVLPFGSPAAIMVEERHVKKARNVGGA